MSRNLNRLLVTIKDMKAMINPNTQLPGTYMLQKLGAIESEIRKAQGDEPLDEIEPSVSE